ncbi:MAG: lipopolysaccharide biosynthesis protein [Acidimicrobiales bacterium]
MSGAGWRRRLDALRRSPEGRRSLFSAVGLAGSSVALALTVYVAARQLGTARYGVYAGIGAFVNLAAMFGASGTKDLLLQRASRDRAELPAAWGVLLAANAVVGVPLLALTVGGAALLLQGRDLTAIALIAVAEYVSAGLVKGPANAWVALDRFPMVAVVNIADAMLRLGATAVLLVGTPEVRRLAVALAIAMAAGAIGVNAALAAEVGRPRLRRAELLPSCRRGLPFSVATISGAVQSNIDQFMLLRAGLDVQAGFYAAGVRFISYSMLPLHAVISSTVPEFYRLGAHSLDAGLRYLRKLAPVVAALSVGGAVVAIIGAGPVGRWFGDRFDGALPVVIALALLPLVRALQILYSNALLGGGHQRAVARLQVATAALNVVANVPLIAVLGWRGAVIATYASEVVNLAGLAVLAGRRRHDRSVTGLWSPDPVPSG